MGGPITRASDGGVRFSRHATAPGTTAIGRRRAEGRALPARALLSLLRRLMGQRALRTFVLVVVSTCTLGSRAARGADVPLTLVVAGRVDRVVAAGAGVAVLRGGGVSLLDADGRVVARCGGAEATAARPRRPDRTARPAEEVLNEAGLDDDDDSPEGEELLDDEGLERPRHRRPVEASAGAPRAVDLAGTPAAVWIATAEGLWRLDANGGCARVGLGGHEVTRVSAAGPTVVALVDATLWRSDDAGASFDVAGVLTSAARDLALAADGSLIVADDDGVVDVRAGAGLRRVVDRPADALVTCGSDVTALADDGVYRVSADGNVERLGPRPPARALACASPDGSRVVAAGVGLWSLTTGDAWTEDVAGLGRSFASVAWAAGRAWVASDDGLFTTAPEGTPRDGSAPQVSRPGANLQPPRSPATTPGPAPPLWASLLPRVALAFDGWTESTGIAGWRVWLLVTFSLNRFEVRRMTRQGQDVEDFR
jgi:hypothetical protein